MPFGRRDVSEVVVCDIGGGRTLLRQAHCARRYSHLQQMQSLLCWLSALGIGRGGEDAPERRRCVGRFGYVQARRELHSFAWMYVWVEFGCMLAVRHDRG